MSSAYTPSAQVTDEASALVDELWRALGRSEHDHNSAGASSSDAGESHAGEPGEQFDGAERRGRQLPCPVCLLRGRADTVDPAAIEGLADVVESAAVGLRAFAAHLARLQTDAAGERATDSSPEKTPDTVAENAPATCRCEGACEDSVGRESARD